MNKFKKFLLDNPQYDKNIPLDEAEWDEQLAKCDPLEKYIRNKKKENQTPNIEE